jgi:light-regulated signal transduction histidine kinase (bacteriophytochrome)
LLIFCLVTICLFLIMIQALRRRIEFQDELQAKVIDLERSHTELEQIAYAASHDLQEPLRKIRVFSNRLTFLKKDKVDPDIQDTMERINNAANRMQELIEDLVILTGLVKEDSHKDAVDLNNIVKLAVHDLDDKVKEKEAVVNVGVMPEVKGDAEQLSILFKALLENSLKFTRQGVKPVITIGHEVVNGGALMDINEKLSHKKFNKITISDNGIGFDNKFAGKMFRIFQRLHNQYSEFDGKGIGLAVCQRIMANHEGYILANGKTDMGATFSLFFPIEEE